jgi:hypothetical protein
MSPINVPRLILGSLVAGAVANVVDFVSNAFLLAEDMDLARQRLGIDPATWESSAAAYTWITVDFVLGFLIVFTYVGIRPRLGPGPTTAMTAGLIVFGAITAMSIGYGQMGVFTTAVVVKAGLFNLVSMMAASLAGGRVYQE